jgi:hypothetical protein
MLPPSSLAHVIAAQLKLTINSGHGSIATPVSRPRPCKGFFEKLYLIYLIDVEELPIDVLTGLASTLRLVGSQ